MTLFTANGILIGVTRGKMRGVAGPMESYIYHAYLDWIASQYDEEPKMMPHCWLNNIKDINDKRAPGNTCLGALQRGDMGAIEKPKNNSKGCGGIMRVAPIGLYFRDH